MKLFCLFILLLFFIPESPRWLIKNNKPQKGFDILTKISGSELAEKEFKEMLKKGEIQLISTSDSGEVAHYGTVGNPSHVMGVWWNDHGEEYLVVDHPNPISKDSYERMKVFFKDK